MTCKIIITSCPKFNCQLRFSEDILFLCALAIGCVAGNVYIIIIIIVCVYVFGERKWYHVKREKNATRGGRSVSRSISHRIILLCMVGAISAENLVKQTTAKEEAVFAQAE